VSATAALAAALLATHRAQFSPHPDHHHCCHSC
jgi:hypothetical protein